MERNPWYDCWLRCEKTGEKYVLSEYSVPGGRLTREGDDPVLDTAFEELETGIRQISGPGPEPAAGSAPSIAIGTFGASGYLSASVTQAERQAAGSDGFVLKRCGGETGSRVIIAGETGAGVLYGVHEFLRRVRTGRRFEAAAEKPAIPLRIVDHWDNFDGSVERGYAGKSLFFRDNSINADTDRIRSYARLLASIGINGITLNNVNVRERETRLITGEQLPGLAALSAIFRQYGIRVFLSVNFASPMHLGGLATADPLEQAVRDWWKVKAAEIHDSIPDFGGFLVKADSEYNPGPYVWGRTHADGANMLARALAPFGGVVIWRCFVYNCRQDWRDRVTDRAKAAYDNFIPLDGTFDDNVLLQIKNGPVDFQVREPVSPLFGAMKKTNQALELQITQEYTGQQIHLCYLVPQWKEVLDFDTQASGRGSTVASVVSGKLWGRPLGGMAGVANSGSDIHLTGHPLAQANLYGFGRLAWNPDLSTETITDEWIRLSYGNDPKISATLGGMLARSWRIYENYTAPLGIGWMVNPNHHYGPNVDGYEYSLWGTYHRADHLGIGVDRTVQKGTGYTAQYSAQVRDLYDDIRTCPEELLLFFHHVPYTHRLSSGKTVIQHIYDTHFEGLAGAEALVADWKTLSPLIRDERYPVVLKRLEDQALHAREWCDVINAYFFRKSGIPDEQGRRTY